MDRENLSHKVLDESEILVRRSRDVVATMDLEDGRGEGHNSFKMENIISQSLPP